MRGLLVFINSYFQFFYSMSGEFVGLPIEQSDSKTVDSILALPETMRYTKQSLGQLLQVRTKYEGKQPHECFCASVRRKVWFKEFTVWYEGYLRSVGATAV